MQLWKVVIILIIIVFLGWGGYNLVSEKRALRKEVAELRSELKNLESENRELISKIEYFKKPENLLKEIKSQFNYREEGEGLIIIVPNATATRP